MKNRNWLVFKDGKVLQHLGSKCFTEDEADALINAYIKEAIWSICKYDIVSGRQEMLLVDTREVVYK